MNLCPHCGGALAGRSGLIEPGEIKFGAALEDAASPPPADQINNSKSSNTPFDDLTERSGEAVQRPVRTPSVGLILDLAYKAARESERYWRDNDPDAKRWIESDTFKALRDAVVSLWGNADGAGYWKREAELWRSRFEDARAERAAVPASDLVLMITTAYEQGFGHWHRDELFNPYSAGSHEHEAWELGRQEGKERHDAAVPASVVPAERLALQGLIDVVEWLLPFQYRHLSKAEQEIAEKALESARAALAAGQPSDANSSSSHSTEHLSRAAGAPSETER